MVQRSLPQTPPLRDVTQCVRVIRHSQVCDKLQISKSKLFLMIAEGKFPRPFRLIPGGRAVGWLECDVDSYILARREAAREAI
jgi:prophage regulatory protein